MNFKEKLQSFRNSINTEKVAEVVDKAEEKTKEAVFGAVETVDQVIEEKKHIPKKVIQTAIDFDKKVDEKITQAGDKIDETLKQTEDSLFTNGKLDKEKVKETTVEIGKKTVGIINNLIKTGSEAARKTYREYVPTPEEKKTIFHGFGTKYNGMFGTGPLKDRLGKSFTFYNVAKEKLLDKKYFRLPVIRYFFRDVIRLREEVLVDIKVNAVTNIMELLNFYYADLSVDNVKKFKEAAKYLV